MVSQISSACVQKFQEYIMITGIDMFSAFDTIIKIKLMKILELFLQENEIVIIKILLSNTAIDIKAFRNISNHFDTNMGFLQSYDLSGCLFIIHLEKALCTLRDRVDNWHVTSEHYCAFGFKSTPLDKCAYTDDTDLINNSAEEKKRQLQLVTPTFSEFNPQFNDTKTEHRRRYTI